MSDPEKLKKVVEKATAAFKARLFEQLQKKGTFVFNFSVNISQGGVRDMKTTTEEPVKI